MIVLDEDSAIAGEQAAHSSTDSDYDSEDESETPGQPHEVADYDRITDKLFFRVYEIQASDDVLLFD